MQCYVARDGNWGTADGSNDVVFIDLESDEGDSLNDMSDDDRWNVARLMANYGHSFEEARMLADHDYGETLHRFQPSSAPEPKWKCAECGDTSEGLMHNNTWRSVEPLMQ